MRPASAPLAVARLGGQPAVDAAFRRAGAREALLELRLRPDAPYAHPIPGEVVPTSNVVLKVVKRTRKRTEGDEGSGDGAVGEYTAVAVGTVLKTARFRSECLCGVSWSVCVLACLMVVLCRHGGLPVPAGHV